MSDPSIVPLGRERDRAGLATDTRVIDADAHVHLPGVGALLPYLPRYWQETIELAGETFFYQPHRMNYPPAMPTSSRPGATLADAEDAEEARSALRRELLDEWDLELAIVSVPHFVDMLHNPYLSAAIARAANDWLIEEWLEPEPRLRGAMLVTAEQPEMAAREIDRIGSHPAIVEVLLPVRSTRPYGNPVFRPIFEAAARNDLVVGLHNGGWPGSAPSSVGWTSHYIEEWAARAQHAQTQLMSIVAEGVFTSIPALRLAVLECGWGWLPAFLWRFDKDWKGLRRETPWLDRAPSEYVREHVRFTLQPVDGPPRRDHLERVLSQVGASESLMFSTDYPHWHHDGDGAIPEPLIEGDPSGVLAGNARAFYRL